MTKLRYRGIAISAGNANELMRGKPKHHNDQREAMEERRTKLSAACKNGKHGACYALNCGCECGHVA